MRSRVVRARTAQDVIHVAATDQTISAQLQATADSMPLKHDPEWEAFDKAAGGKTTMASGPDILKKRRAHDRALIAMSKLLPQLDTPVETSDEQISSHVKVRIYKPDDRSGKLPLTVFCHGGGWLAGNLDTEDYMCRVVCSKVRSVIVSVDYQLAPEVKFPVPIDDCYAAYQWAQLNASKLGADPKRCILWGGSAGGGLATAVTYRAVNNNQPVAGLVVMGTFACHPDAVPEAYRSLHTSYIDNAGDIPVISVTNCYDAWSNAGAGPPYSDASWFPETGGPQAFRGFPPTYIHNTDLEAMRDDGAVLEAELKDAGIAVRRDVQIGYPHYFWCFPVEKGGKAFRELLVNGFGWVLDQSKTRNQASL